MKVCYRCSVLFVLLNACLYNYAGAAPVIQLDGTVVEHGPVAEVPYSVVQTGGEDVRVRVFYGTNDGGVVEEEWQCVTEAGTQGVGSYSVALSDLDADTVYSFRLHAQNESGATWLDSSHIFTNMHYSAFDEEEVNRAVQELIDSEVEYIIQQMTSDGSSRPDTVAVTDHMSNLAITNWSSFMEHYGARLLDPCVVFDADENPSDNLGDITNAFRAFTTHAYADNIAFLKNMSDDSGKQLITKWTAGGNVLFMFPELSRVTVLMIMEVESYDGVRYSGVLARREAAVNPKANLTVYELTVFRLSGEQWMFSGDWEDTRMCGFANYGGVTNYAPWDSYTNRYERMKSSELPAHFYTIE